MTTHDQVARAKIYNFYLRRLKSGNITSITEVRKMVWDIAGVRILQTAPKYLLDDPEFTTCVNIEVEKIAEGIGRWLFSQQELVKREYKKSGVADPELLKMLLGLSTTQARTVTRYYRISPSQAKKVAAKSRKQRVNTIADTESTRLSNEVKQIIWRGAQKAGQIPIFARKEWHVTNSVPCQRCAHMDGQIATITGSFITPEGYFIDNAPLHPNCGCKSRVVGR